MGPDEARAPHFLAMAYTQQALGHGAESEGPAHPLHPCPLPLAQAPGTSCHSSCLLPDQFSAGAPEFRGPLGTPRTFSQIQVLQVHPKGADSTDVRLGAWGTKGFKNLPR